MAGRTYLFLSRRGSRILGIIAALVIAVSLTALLLWSMTGDNALSIHVGGEHFGYIAYAQDVDEAVLTEEVRNRIQARETAQVLLNEQITILPARTAQNNLLPFNEAIEQLAASLGFLINGIAVELDGNRIAVLRSESEANDLVRRLQAPFLRGSPESYYSVDFVEDFRLVSGAAAEEDELADIGYVLDRLNRSTTVTSEYIVQAGDTLGGIALRHNTTLAQIYEDNPDITPATVLRIGDVLRINYTRPYLSVRTVEAETRTEYIPIRTDEISNPVEPVGFTDIIQEGAVGEQEVIVHIIRVNGIQTEPEQTIATHVLREMSPRIVEVGTHTAG
jgi:LysM repeat protein